MRQPQFNQPTPERHQRLGRGGIRHPTHLGEQLLGKVLFRHRILTLANRAAAQQAGRAVLVAGLGLPCPYCGQPMVEPDRSPSRDHIRARLRKGTLEQPGNVAIVCSPCNSDKGSHSLEHWVACLERDGDPRASHVKSFMQWQPRLIARKSEELRD